MKFLVTPSKGEPKIVESSLGYFDAAGAYLEHSGERSTPVVVNAHFHPGPEPHLEVRSQEQSLRVVAVNEMADALRQKMRLRRSRHRGSGRPRTAGDA